MILANTIGMKKAWAFLFSAISTNKYRASMSVLHVEKEGAVLVTTDGRRCHIVRIKDAPKMENGEYRLMKAGSEWTAEKTDAGEFPAWTHVYPKYAGEKAEKTVGVPSTDGMFTTSILYECIKAYDATISAEYVKPFVQLGKAVEVRGRDKDSAVVLTARWSDNITFEAIIMPFSHD